VHTIDQQGPKQERENMVKNQISARGVRDEKVLEALKTTPRRHFVMPEYQDLAYQDRPLPIEENQTISQPYIVGLMLEAMRIDSNSKVLEVGTGSGYAAAVASQIAREVFTIERHGSLAAKADERLKKLGYKNVNVRHGDGTKGWPEAAPFDSIVVAAGGAQVPETLKSQLKLGGRLVIPVGEQNTQALMVITRNGQKEFEERKIANVRFVPLISGSRGPN
jgi:protein-L-isoaspartate(D-aspartate) O-methyltransferase